MKANELRIKDKDWLHKEIESLLKAQFVLRMQKSMQQLSNISQIRKIRRDIARIHTVLAQKEKEMKNDS